MARAVAAAVFAAAVVAEQVAAAASSQSGSKADDPRQQDYKWQTADGSPNLGVFWMIIALVAALLIGVGCVVSWCRLGCWCCWLCTARRRSKLYADPDAEPSDLASSRAPRSEFLLDEDTDSKLGMGTMTRAQVEKLQDHRISVMRAAAFNSPADAEPHLVEMKPSWPPTVRKPPRPSLQMAIDPATRIVSVSVPSSVTPAAAGVVYEEVDFHMPVLVMTDRPLPLVKRRGYFEIVLLQTTATANVSIGWAPRNYLPGVPIGAIAPSVGMRLKTGKVQVCGQPLSNFRKGVFRAGDTIGCGFEIVAGRTQEPPPPLKAPQPTKNRFGRRQYKSAPPLSKDNNKGGVRFFFTVNGSRLRTPPGCFAMNTATVGKDRDGRDASSVGDPVQTLIVTQLLALARGNAHPAICFSEPCKVCFVFGPTFRWIPTPDKPRKPKTRLPAADDAATPAAAGADDDTKGDSSDDEHVDGEDEPEEPPADLSALPRYLEPAEVEALRDRVSDAIADALSNSFEAARRAFWWTAATARESYAQSRQYVEIARETTMLFIQEAQQRAAPVIQTARERAEPALQAARQRAAPVVNAARQRLDPVLTAAQARISPYWAVVRARTTPAVQAVRQHAVPAMANVVEAAVPAISRLKDQAKAKAAPAIEVLKTTAQPAVKKVQEVTPVVKARLAEASVALNRAFNPAADLTAREDEYEEEFKRQAAKLARIDSSGDGSDDDEEDDDDNGEEDKAGDTTRDDEAIPAGRQSTDQDSKFPNQPADEVLDAKPLPLLPADRPAVPSAAVDAVLAAATPGKRRNLAPLVGSESKPGSQPRSAPISPPAPKPKPTSYVVVPVAASITMAEEPYAAPRFTIPSVGGGVSMSQQLHAPAPAGNELHHQDDDDSDEWVCLKCRRLNPASATACGHCQVNVVVAPGFTVDMSALSKHH